MTVSHSNRSRAGYVQRLRWRVLPTLHPLGDRLGRPLVRDKTTRRDEFVCSVSCSLDTLDHALGNLGWRQNPFSTLKYRDTADGRQWEVATWVWRESLRAEWMDHTWCFESLAENAEFDLYAHREINYLYSPVGHVSGPRESGDVNGRLRVALEEAGIEYERRSVPGF